MTPKTKQFNRSVICCYLYIISKYGYPPPAEKTFDHLKKMKSLGFQSVELEGIREEHLMKMYEMREDTKNMIDADVISHNISTLYPLVKGDTVEIVNSGGSSITLNANGIHNVFSIVRIK